MLTVGKKLNYSYTRCCHKTNLIMMSMSIFCSSSSKKKSSKSLGNFQRVNLLNKVGLVEFNAQKKEKMKQAQTHDGFKSGARGQLFLYETHIAPEFVAQGPNFGQKGYFYEIGFGWPDVAHGPCVARSCFR